MSSLSEPEDLNPHDPLYYAPRSLRERSHLPSTPPVIVSERSGQPASAPTAHASHERTISDSLRRALDPDVMAEPPGFVRELDRRMAMVSVAGRFAAAVGVSALVALFFVIMFPAARQSDGGGSFSAAFQSLRTALNQRPSAKVEEAIAAVPEEAKATVPEEAKSAPPDEQKSALAEFQTVLTPAQPSQPVLTHEQSEALLHQLEQWRQKPASTP